MGNIVKKGSRSSIGQGFQGTSDISLPKTKIIKYPTRPPLKLSLFDLNRISACLSVTLEAFLVDNFLPLVAGQCYIKAIWLCRPNSYRVAEKRAIAKYTEEKRIFLE